MASIAFKIGRCRFRLFPKTVQKRICCLKSTSRARGDMPIDTFTLQVSSFTHLYGGLRANRIVHGLHYNLCVWFILSGIYIYICCVDAICIYIILRICIHIVFYSHLIYSVLANWQPYFVWVLIQSNLQAMILGFRVVKRLGFRHVSQTRCRGPEPCKPKPGGRQSTGG